MANQQLNPKIDPRQQKGPPQQPGPPLSPWREFITWILILIFFAVWYVVVLWPKAHPQVNIPYSAFLAQVQASNVAKVQIDQEVQRLLEERHKAVYELLIRAREKLDRLVKTLLQEETVGQHMLAELLGPRPQQNPD